MFYYACRFLFLPRGPLDEIRSCKNFNSRFSRTSYSFKFAVAREEVKNYFLLVVYSFPTRDEGEKGKGNGRRGRSCSENKRKTRESVARRLNSDVLLGVVENVARFPLSRRKNSLIGCTQCG